MHEATIHDKKWDIIIAEDDEDDYYFFKLIIEELAIDTVVLRVEHGDALLQILSSRLPDIVFLDLLMPRKDGMDALKEIRQHEGYNNIVVIVLSSVQEQNNIRLCYESGADRYVYKDNTFSLLKSKLYNIFNTEWERGSGFRSFEEFTCCL